MRSLTEWLLALGVLAGVVWAGGPVVRRMIPPPAGTVTLVESELPALPDGVPAGASSAPLMILADGTELRVGMSEDALRETPLARMMAGPPSVVRGILGDRIVLPYRSGRTAFWLVLDRIDKDKDREITAIYIR